MTHSMLAPTSLADGHGPQWAAAVADLVDRAGAAFDPAVQGCLTVMDLEPWRRADAWWLRNRLEPLAHAKVSQRAVRYVPCVGPGPKPAEAQAQALADAWSAGAPPVTLDWPAHKAAPHCAHSGHAWVPDGPVLILAGELAQRLPQDLMLAHHGEIKLWAGEPGAQAWQAVDATRHSPWVTQSVLGYAQGLPSAMFSLPLGYWRFLEKAVAWAAHGVLVLSRAPGWSSLADFREDAATRADVSAEIPPVNFHWLAQQAPRLGASAHAVHAGRSDAVQLLGAGLDSGNNMLALLTDPLRSALQSSRADRARAVRTLANQGDLSAALAVLESSGHDPALLRAAWDALAHSAVIASPALSAQLGAWLDRVTANTP
ncbi:MAG: hypothetical protein H7238_12370, partial [Polaromonas sp.]|nr:hypothetical protein [Polaromonas sp.]